MRDAMQQQSYALLMMIFKDNGNECCAPVKTETKSDDKDYLMKD